MSACSKKVRFENSSVVPAAEGKVKISKNDNGNYQLDFNIVNLAEPSKLTPSKKYYVVWMETKENGLKNLGQLKSSSGYFSSLLKAEMRAITPYKPIKVFITAENDPIVENPGNVIFSTSKF
ncbi:hypothetical protein EZJ43_09940 [Pedobacter changchengzhani]|uniref:Anti-sigma factor n=1 Tax=Pedobacter changchengzhani TaxID=2529274 RepID=A0A4R5MM01_9SPHI|nr:hypothetical protein EZJ43_09940 [Pedobacter changchengzhani]